MEFFKKKDKEPSINWDLVDKKAREVYKLIYSESPITFLEIDCILNLVQTECNMNKYRFLLSSTGQKIAGEDIVEQMKKAPDNLYG